jgi:hypothetical protein
MAEATIYSRGSNRQATGVHGRIAWRSKRLLTGPDVHRSRRDALSGRELL